jgi:hypothetical protein
MNNTDEASLYCRCLEIITSSPHKMLKMQTMCSSSFSGKEQSLTVPRLLLWPTSLVHRDVACWMWCRRLRASCRLWLPFIASLHYINPPKLAISHHSPAGIRRMVATCEEVGGMAWVALWRAFLKQGNIVFWWFLQSYMTSCRSSYWYLLLIEQRIFLY